MICGGIINKSYRGFPDQSKNPGFPFPFLLFIGFFHTVEKLLKQRPGFLRQSVCWLQALQQHNYFHNVDRLQQFTFGSLIVWTICSHSKQQSLSLIFGSFSKISKVLLPFYCSWNAIYEFNTPPCLSDFTFCIHEWWMVYLLQIYCNIISSRPN